MCDEPGTTTKPQVLISSESVNPEDNGVSEYLPKCVITSFHGMHINKRFSLHESTHFQVFMTFMAIFGMWNENCHKSQRLVAGLLGTVKLALYPADEFTKFSHPTPECRVEFLRNADRHLH